mgnify:CR=1 FL=1
MLLKNANERLRILLSEQLEPEVGAQRLRSVHKSRINLQQQLWKPSIASVDGALPMMYSPNEVTRYYPRSMEIRDTVMLGAG